MGVFEQLQKKQNQGSGGLFNQLVKPPEPIQQEPKSNWFADSQKAIYNKTLKPAQDFVQRFASGTTTSPTVRDFMRKNQLESTPGFVQEMISEPDTTSEKVADIAGTLYGYGAAGVGASALLRKPVEKLVTKKLGRLAIEGAGAGAGITAGEIARDESFSPDMYDWKDHSINAGLNIAGGAVADPLIVLGGPKVLGALKRFFGKDKVKKSELTKALDDPTTPQEVKDEILQLPEGKTFMKASETPQPIQERFIGGKKNTARDVSREYNKALEEQFQLLKNQSKTGGHQKGGTMISLDDKANSIYQRYGTVSNRPQWYQEFKKAHGREPTQKDLRKLAEEQLKNGYMEGGSKIPAWQPKSLSEIDEGITEVQQMMLKNNDPSLQTTLTALAQGREKVSSSILKNNRARTPKDGRTLKKPSELNLNVSSRLKDNPINFTMLDKKPLEYVGRIAPMNKTKIQKVDPLTPDSLSLRPRDFDSPGVLNNNGLQANREVAAGLLKAPQSLSARSKGLKPPPLKSLKLQGDKPSGEGFNPLLEHASDWKNKWTPALKRETMERNFDDIMGADAPKMKEEYLEPIKISEATRTRFLDKNRNEVRDLGIKFKSEDDKLVQQYGEKVITLDELKSKTDNWKQVEKAADTMRAKYDELFNTLNEALVRNGYDAVPKRKDYFPHYEEIDNTFTKLGFDIKNFELPTEIIGRTQNFKPGKNFFGNILPRLGKKTTYGFIEGFDRYIEGASRVIHHTENIKKLRKLENDIRSEHGQGTHLGSFVTDLQDYTNNLSGKQSASDRGLESNLGRGIYTALDAFRRKVSLNMIGGNVGAALTNFISVTHSLATNSKKEFAEGLYDAAKNVFKKDGFVNESNFLTRRYGSDRLAQGKLDKVIDKSMVFMREFDRFASNIIVRSKFKEGLSKGLPRKEALKQADNWAAKIMADRSLGQMPTYFNSKSLGTLIQFQLEVNNQISFLMKDIPRNMDKKKTASALAQVAVYGYLYNEVFEKMAGRRVALDPIGLVVKAFEDFTNPEIDKSRAASNTVKNTTDQLPFTSIFTGGRIPMSAAFPSPKAIIERPSLDTIKEEAYKPLTYLLPPTAGGQIKKTYQGLTAMNKNPLAKQGMPGLYQENPKGEKYLKYPIENSLANNLKAPIFGKYSTPETEEYYGNKRRPLSPLQTKKLERAESSGRDTNKLYNNLQIDRRIGTLETKIKDTRGDKRLTLQEKQKEVEKLRKLIKELRNKRK